MPDAKGQALPLDVSGVSGTVSGPVPTLRGTIALFDADGNLLESRPAEGHVKQVEADRAELEEQAQGEHPGAYARVHEE